MDKNKMTTEEIEKFNANVDFNQSTASWIMDIICTLIAWPIIVLVIRRRLKYSEKIEMDHAISEQSQ